MCHVCVVSTNLQDLSENFKHFSGMFFLLVVNVKFSATITISAIRIS